MSKTLIVKEIDGYQIIAGLGKAIKDPVRTRAALKAAMADGPEQKKYLQVVSSQEKLLRAATEQLKRKRLQLINTKLSGKLDEQLKESDEYKLFALTRAGADMKKTADIEKVSRLWRDVQLKKRELASQLGKVDKELAETSEYKNWLELKDKSRAEIKKAYQATLAARQKLLGEKVIYFEPKAGEELVSDDEAEQIRARLKALPKKTLLTRDDNIIEDRRGDEYFEPTVSEGWTQKKVEKLGEVLPEDIIFKADLTEETGRLIAEDNEHARLNALTEEEKQAEFERIEKGILREAALKKQEFEIEGATAKAALKQAREWKQTQIDELKTRYGQV